MKENLTQAEFQELYGGPGRLDIPEEASSIYVCSYSTIDDWDVRILMDLPPLNAQEIVDHIRTNVQPDAKHTERILQEIQAPTGEGSEPLNFKGWPEHSDVPTWWRSVNAKDYRVVAIATDGEIRCIWLYNDNLHKMAMWRYYSAAP